MPAKKKQYKLPTYIISKPKHPVFKKAIDIIVFNYDYSFYVNDCLCLTGHALLGKALNFYLYVRVKKLLM
jgi:hypothetical protein